MEESHYELWHSSVWRLYRCRCRWRKKMYVKYPKLTPCHTQCSHIYWLFFHPKDLRTEQHEAKLDVSACNEYVVGVGVADSRGMYRQPKSWKRIATPYDARQPPAIPQMIIEGNEIRFTWHHNCNLTGQQPPNYVFRSHDLTLNKIVEASVGLSYRMNYIRGSEYNFSIRTPVEDAVPCVWLHKAPPLPSPYNFNYALHSFGARYHSSHGSRWTCQTKCEYLWTINAHSQCGCVTNEIFPIAQICLWIHCCDECDIE